MKFLVKAVLIASVMTAGTAVAQSNSPKNNSNRKLSVEMQREDFKQLNTALVFTHPGVFRYISQGSLARSAKELESQLDKSRTPLEFFRLVSPHVSKIRCGHTWLLPSESDPTALQQNRPVLPLRLRRLGGRWWVHKILNENDAIEPGLELLSINGKTMQQIEKILLPKVPGDGFIETGKIYTLEQLFPFFYAIYVELDPKSYRLELMGADGDLIDKEIRGISLSKVEPESPAFPYQVKFMNNGQHALLDVRSFSSDGFNKFLKETFAEFKQRETKVLTLDLRGNGGGLDIYGANLCSYLINRPFGYFKEIEVTKAYAKKKNGKGIELNQDGGHIVTTSKGLPKQKNQKDVFTGQVFVFDRRWHIFDGR